MNVKKRIADLFAELPHDYDERAAAMTSIDQAFHHEMATQIQDALKTEMSRRAHSTYEEKKEFSKWVNGELRRYGLAIKAKIKQQDEIGHVVDTVHPGMLAVNVGKSMPYGAFRIICKPNSSKPIFPICTQSLSTLLEAFEVMADDPDRKRVGKWTNQTQARRGDNLDGGRGP